MARYKFSRQESEDVIIGSLLIQSDCIDDVIAIIKPEYFSSPDYQQIFRMIISINNKSKGYDNKTLAMKLSRDEKYQPEKPWSVIFSDAINTVQNPRMIVQLANELVDYIARTELEFAAKKIELLAQDTELETDELLGQSEKIIQDISDTKQSGVERVSSADNIIHESFALLDKRIAGEVNGHKTGYEDMDKFIRLRPGEVVVLGARPGMGKTALGMNMACRMAMKEKVVLFFSLEMDAIALMDRTMCGLAEIDHSRYLNGTIEPDERMKLLEAGGRLSQTNLMIDDNPIRNVNNIASVARKYRRKNGLDIIFLDYVQLVTPLDNKVSRQEQVAGMSRRIKQIARDLKVPIVCMAQLNRLTESATDNQPKLSHLRESGGIEQDADVVMFIHRPGYYKNNATTEELAKAEILFRKNRNGPTGEITLIWQPHFVRFVSSAEHLVKQNHYSEFDGFDQKEEF